MTLYTHLAGRARTAGTILATAILLAGCGTKGTGDTRAAQAQSAAPAPAASAGNLAGTRWRLVEIQSMDDSVGTKRPADPSKYTMDLGADGSVSMSLDCNSAKGTWSATPGSDASSGRFEFGPLAATSALCPPPHLDEQISGQAQYVRSYLVKDGRLFLSLLADGGIYVWEPIAAGEFQTRPDPEIEAAILRASRSYTRAVVDQMGGTGRGRYVYSRVDLNGDGRDEALVYLLGSIFCGTGGCNLLILTPGAGGGYSLVNSFPISRTPVIVSPGKAEGWNDIWRLESGGGAPASYVRHSFDGKRYVQRERVPANQPPEGRSYLAGELTFAKGIPLEPRD